MHFLNEAITCFIVCQKILRRVFCPWNSLEIIEHMNQSGKSNYHIVQKYTLMAAAVIEKVINTKDDLVDNDPEPSVLCDPFPFVKPGTKPASLL